MRSLFILASVFCLLSSASAQSVIRTLAWEVNTARPAVQEWSLVRGETADLECRYTAGALVMDVRGASVVLHCRTNGMAEGYSFQVTGQVGRVSSTNLASVGWVTVRVIPNQHLPHDVSRCTYTLETTLSGARNLVATGTLRLSGDPTGASPVSTGFGGSSEASAQTVSNTVAIAALGSAITNEAALRAMAETSLNASLTNEAALRAMTDTSLNASLTNEAALRAMADTSLNASLTNEAALRSASEASILHALSTNRTSVWHDQEQDIWWTATGGTNLTSYRLVPSITNFVITVLSGNFISEAQYYGMAITNQPFPFDVRIEDNPGLIGVWPPGLSDSPWFTGALAYVYSDAEYDAPEWRAESTDFPQILYPQNQWSSGTARVDRIIIFTTNVVGSFNLSAAPSTTITLPNTQPTNLVLRLSASNEYIISEGVLP